MHPKTTLRALACLALFACGSDPEKDTKKDGDTATDTGPTGDTSSEEICEGSYEVSTQEEMAALEHCTHIEGDILLNSEVETLNFPNLVSIGGNFAINDAHALSSLDGLPLLESVGGDFTLDNLNSLQSLAGLPKLKSVGNLHISALFLMGTFRGFHALETVGILRIDGNAKLQVLIEFKKLVAVQRLEISWNYSLCESRVETFFELYPQAVNYQEMNKNGC